jgi:hypothetical protein
MNTIKKLYKEFFGIKEAVTPTSNIPKILPAGEIEKSIQAVQKYGKAMKAAGLIETDELDEAELINHMGDYKGGVEYVVIDPAQAKATAMDIRQWAEKKGFTVVQQTISPSGKVGYFYFRLGENPYKESKKIQGYISQLPMIKHFRFNVKNQETPNEPTRREM